MTPFLDSGCLSAHRSLSRQEASPSRSPRWPAYALWSPSTLLTASLSPASTCVPNTSVPSFQPSPGPQLLDTVNRQAVTSSVPHLPDYSSEPTLLTLFNEVYCLCLVLCKAPSPSLSLLLDLQPAKEVGF